LFKCWLHRKQSTQLSWGCQQKTQVFHYSIDIQFHVSIMT
jgi:hypothetical protein